ncbi:GD18965 [Drosophila simulans]|uniref:GD18965 n=1 Tax=Drosophila simulans TaxID=7240 RepID=B4QZT6_DROSI|nr:GD18965 [Drosophila simulans]
MFVTVDNTNTFFSDNPYYFCNDTKSPRTPDSQSSSRGFSIFKRRNSKGSSPRPLVMTNPEQMRLITSANLDTTATMALGSPRGSFNSLAGYPQHAIELQTMNMYRQRSANSHSEFRERLNSCNETHSSQCPGGGGASVAGDHDEVFNPLTSPTSSKSHRHHTLPSGGTRRHSLGNWAQQQHQQQNSGAMGLGSPDEVPSMMAPRPPLLSPNKFRGSSHRRRGELTFHDTCISQLLSMPRGNREFLC